MEESSQQSTMDVESQQTLEESQMSMDQDIQESLSEMETSPRDDDTQPECAATVPKQPKIQPDVDAASTVPTTQQQSAEPDKDLFQNGHKGDEEYRKEGEEYCKEGAEKSTTGKEEEESEEDEDGYGFPDTLEGFKYAFNEHGQLRHTETAKPFKFDVRKHNMHYNQLHYEALGEVITDHIYGLLESETNLKKVYLGDSEPRSFVFMTKNAQTTTDKLLILIHGSGVVRAGQWARRLIINDCLNSGTQIPYIKRAIEEGYEVLVMNTNDNYATSSDGRRIPIKGSSGPSEHGLHVWDNFVAEIPAKHVAIVAHSYGGVVTVDIAFYRMEGFKSKVFAVAFTDSVHHFYDVGDELHTLFINKAVNWVSSHEVLGTVIDDRGYDCKRVSAGTMKHEETSWYSLNPIFEFLKVEEQKVKSHSGENAVAAEATESKGDDSELKEDEEGGDDERKPREQETESQQTEAQETEIGGRETEL